MKVTVNGHTTRIDVEKEIPNGAKTRILIRNVLAQCLKKPLDVKK